MHKINSKAFFWIVILLVCGLLFFFYGRGLWMPVKNKIHGKKTTNDIVELYGSRARDALTPYFKDKDISYPPKNITFLAVKNASKLEVWTENEKQENVFIRSYQIQKLSGKSGPKLREGDYQVPEGIYKIIGLNPNSSYHLSMKLNYPNAFDLKHANKEGRTEPGSNIFIHGKAVSVGCLAMGDQAIEELFVLSKDVGISNISVVIAPHDPRLEALKYDEKKPEWVAELYEDISAEFVKYTSY